LTRFLKYINYTIGFVSASALLVAYWTVYRPLAKTSGSETLPVSAPAAIVRDARGVPHIQAATAEDAWFLQGYAEAQDRLFQMEILRRQAKGELAAVLGSSAAERDIEVRRYRLHKLAADHTRRLPAADRIPLIEFARGVNAFLERNRGNLPLEFRVIGFEPDPWTAADSIAIALQTFRAITDTWKEELLKSSMLVSGDPEKVNELFPVRTGGEIQLGSNAWVLSAKRTGTGKPILATDPHLRFSAPSIWYQSHLRGGSMNVAGVNLPGLPGILIGHNERIAWGFTVLHFDVQDLYPVKSGPVAQETESIQVRNAQRLESTVLVTRHGPVTVSEGGNAYAMRWVGAMPGMFEFPLAELNQASTWDEFRKALSRFPGPGGNFLYADVDGNIGYQAAGKLPLRKGWAGDIPAPAGGEWTGVIPFDELPRAFNPDSGVLISSNQNPFPENFPYPVNGNFAAPYRNRQIAARLASKPKWTLLDTLGLQYDIYSAPAHFIARQLVAAVKSKQAPGLEEAAAMLSAWNGQMEADRPEPYLATLALLQLRRELVERAAPGKGAAYDAQMASAVAEKLLRARPAGWFPDWDELLVKVLRRALDDGIRAQGRTMTSWMWGRANYLLLEHPVLSRVPAVGGYFRLGPAGLNGGVNTIATATQRVGPSMRFVADLSSWDRSVMNLVLGQSGQPFSPNYKDQFERWSAGGSFPMQFDKVEASNTLRIAPLR
jgi:penicillin amidase